MATEIFIEPELMELEEVDKSTEWFETASQLGLQEQLKYAEKSEEKKAPPYMYVDPKTSRIIKTLCPVQVDYKNYKASTIPLDILKEIQKAEQNGWYRRIEICYDNKSPDPFVIGLTKAEHNWNSDIHLIARWGSELLPFEILEQKALARIKQNATESLKMLNFLVKNALEDVDLFNTGLLGGNEIPKLEYSVPDLSKW